MSEARGNSSSRSAEMTVSEPKDLAEDGGSHVPPRSFSSIKRSVKKVPSEGLIVLSPEPGLVTFESDNISRPGSSMDSMSVVRGGSAGRVERSLKLARKRELDSETPRRNSTGAEGTDHSIISNLEELKLGGQVEGMESTPKTAKDCSDQENSADSELSTESDESDSGQPHCGGTEQSIKVEAPVELKGEFLKAVMDEDFFKAKELCHKILLLEPDNKICSEFHAVIVEKMKQDEADEGEDSGDGDDDSSGTESNESDEEEEEDEDEESDESEEDEDSENDDSSSDDDVTPLSGPINLIMGGLPIRPQSR